MAILHIPPRPFDPARAARVKEALAERGFVSSEPLLDAVFGNSAFLGRLAQREVGALGEYFAAGPHTVLNAAIALAHAASRADSEAPAMKDLRTARRRASTVQLLCPECGAPTRIGHRALGDGRKVRFCRKCQGVVDK